MKNDKSLLILEKAKNVGRLCEALQSNELFFRLNHNLIKATQAEDTMVKMPLIAAIIGGTGAGKSFIFSKLCNRPDASPSSGSVRGFTKKLFIAAGANDMQKLPFTGEEATFVADAVSETVLIDTPDFDTIIAENARLAGETIRIADIIIVVTTPDKRSNFAIHQKIIEWASRKRWFFVINKTDTAPDTSNELLKSDLVEKLRTMGFSVDMSAIFAFSARQTDSDEFNRFKNAVLSHRTLGENSLLREEAAVRRILFALNNEKTTEKIQKLLRELTEFKSTLAARIAEQRQLILQSAAIKGMLADSLQSSIYREMTTNASLFLYPYFALINLFSPGITPENAQKAVEMATASNSRLSDCYTDERRFLEDRSLADVSTAGPTSLTVNNDVLFQIVATAQKTSESALLKFYLILGNMLPVFLLISAVYRASVCWLNGVWLPTDFFVHATALIAVATFPGYLLAAKGIKRMVQSFLPAPNEKNAGLAKLESNIAAIDRVLHESSILCSTIDDNLVELQRQLPRNAFGISTNERP